jgi:type I restriction enzyme S subunit
MTSTTVVELGDICRPKQWPTLSKKVLAENGFPVYGANGKIGFYSSYTHQEPTLLIGCRGSCGSVHITEPYSYANGNAMALDDLNQDRADIKYLYHLFVRRGFRDVITGTSQPQIIQQHIRSVEIPLPPLEEQRRIAAILDTINQLKQLRKRSKETIDLLKQASFRSAIINRKKHPSDEFHIPLGDCLSFITSGGRGWSKYYADSGFRFIRSGDVRMNSITRSNPQHVQPPDNAEAKRTRVFAGDVLLTITGSRIGRVAPACSEDSGAFISQHVAIIRVDHTKLLPSFVSFYLSMPDGGQAQIKKSQYGQTKPGLNFEQIQRFSIPNLSLDEQIRVMSDIAHIDRMLDAQSMHATKLDEALTAVSALAFSASI